MMKTGRVMSNYKYKSTNMWCKAENRKSGLTEYLEVDTYVYFIE